MSKNKATPTKKIESESEESSEEEVKPTTTKTPVTTKAPTKTAPTPVKKTEESGSSSEESDEVAKPATTKTQVAPPAQKKAAKVPPTTTAKKEESSEESESEEVKAKPVTTKPGTTKTPVKTTAPVTTPAKKVESEEESSEEEVKPAKGVAKPATTTPVAKKGKDESSGSEEESSEEIKRITSDDNPKGLKRKRDEVDNSTNKKRKIENGGSNGGSNGGGGSVKVRLGNLSFELDGQVDEIKNQFTDCGEILNVEMIAKQDGRWAGVAILEFASQDGANKALEMHDQDFWGRKMSLSYPKEFGGGAKGTFKNEVKEKPEGCNTVFIGNLNYQITEEEVKEFFSQCGDVKDVRWPQGEFKGYGWVEFTDTEAPDKAIELAGQDLMGRPVRVDYAAPRKERERW